MRCVIDATIAIKWLVAEPDSAAALELLPGPFLAPELFQVECLNTLWSKTRRGELNDAELKAAVSALAKLPVTWVPTTPLLPQILQLGLRLAHPVYDCSYLAVAMEYGIPLLTADGRFARRCRQPDVADLAAHLRLLGEPLEANGH